MNAEEARRLTYVSVIDRVGQYIAVTDILIKDAAEKGKNHLDDAFKKVDSDGAIKDLVEFYRGQGFTVRVPTRFHDCEVNFSKGWRIEW